MANRHSRFTAGGARVVGISVDPPERNSAMIEKLGLPFPLLSDPDGDGAIGPYGVWHEGAGMARPAVVLVAPDGPEAFRQVGADPTDRAAEGDVLHALGGLALAPVEQPPPVVGEARPGPDAYPAENLSP